jgi:anti-sigma regulatory factor (Ser/Thr protein kinase)
MVTASIGLAPPLLPPAGVTHLTNLRVPARPDDVRAARGALAGALDAGGWSHESPRILLAAGEALANALVHGSEPDAEIEVAVSISDTRVTVRVRDRGRTDSLFTGAGEIPEMPPFPRTHGRGRPLMGAVADRFETRPGLPGTEVRLEFRPRVEDLAA